MRYIFAVMIMGGFLITGICQAKGAKMVHEGSKVAFDYTLTVDNTVIDSSKGKEPIQYTQGQGQLIPGLEKNLTGLAVGEEKVITVSPEDAYGQVDPQAVREISRKVLPQEVEPKPGMILALKGPQGQSVPVRIAEVKDDTVVLDLNHPLAGKTLTFDVKIVSVE
jgi:FKBP-type peptidyl-prolyl cis-trans isomerase SlyD